MKRWYITITLIITLGALFAIIIPALVSYSIQSTVIQAIKHDYGLEKCGYIRVSPGALSPLYGSIDRVYIECPKCDLNGIKVESLTITLRDIKFDLKRLIFDRKLTIKKIGKATARLVVDEAEINRYIWENYPDLRGWTVGFKHNEVVASAEIEVIGRLDVVFKPRLKGDKLVLEILDARFARIGYLGLREAQNWISDIALEIPVNNLPFDMKVYRVLAQDKQLMVTARN